MKIFSLLGLLLLAGCNVSESPGMKWHRLNLEMQTLADEQTVICKKADPTKVWGFNGVSGPMCVQPDPPKPVAPAPAK